MNEQEKTQEKEQEESKINTDSGDSSKPTSLVDKADAAAKRLEKANAETARLLAKKEELMAREKLGGVTEAGTPSKKEEESDEEYAKRVLEGRI